MLCVVKILSLSLCHQLKAVIEEQFQANPQGGERVRDLVQQQVMEVGREVAEQSRMRCSQLTHQHCDSEVEAALGLLLPPDISPQVWCNAVIPLFCWILFPISVLS